MADGRARRFGAFEALQLLVGKGGQGRLFAARCLEEGAFEGLHVGDEVVLKAMPVRADDPEKAYRRLARRTAALVAARHPGIVRYYGCFEAEGGGIDDAMHVVVMELLRGETLEERLKREPLGLDGAESLAIVRTCLEALVHAASFGIVHRDIKPSNVFLCEDGGVKLIDFEVARQATSAQTTTESGAMQGTFDYMAPDFHPNFRPDPKFRGDQCSDVFSLAVTFHEMLAGRRPYAASQTLGDQSMMAFFQRWTRAEGVDPRRAIRVDGVRVHALRHLQRILRKALQPERAARYQTYAEFLAALSRVEPRVLEGERGRYRLSKCIGKGGFGVVYKAFRESDGAAVAIKVLLRAEYAERFDREGRVLMRFDDDRIVTFVEAFAGGDPMSPTHFLVMRYLEGMPGSSLKDRLAADPSRRGLPRAETLAAFVRFAEGLQILHDEGVYHRDVKPANLYFPAGAPERACLMDLGVVRTDETQTNGGLPGTLDYMAPELATGGSRGDASADLYALGLCLYEALTGRTAYPRLPRGSEGVAAFYARARSGEEPDLSGLDDEPELQALVRSMIAADRSERPASAREAARLLRSVPFREDEPREAVSADGVYSEDTTDDLVLPPTPPPSASAPSFASSSSGSAPEEASVPPPEEEGGETRALPGVGGGETVAALGEGERAGGETAAFPPEAAEAAEPAAAPEAEGDAETAVAPEPEPAAAAEAEAETRAPGDGETVAAAEAGDETVAGEPGETSAAADETAASPTAVAAEGLTATAVAETVAPEGGTTTAAVEGLTGTAATMAAESGTTTAVAEGFTATAATMAAEGETAATAAVDETSATAATAAFEPAEPARPARRSARSSDRSSKGVREVRPASRWRSFAAAACVLLLCGAAAGVYVFQDRLHDILNPPPVLPPVGTTTTTTTIRSSVLEPAPSGTQSGAGSSASERIDGVRILIDTFNLSLYKDAVPSNDEITAVDAEKDKIKTDIREAFANHPADDRKEKWTSEVDNTAKVLWGKYLEPMVNDLTTQNPRLNDLANAEELERQGGNLKTKIDDHVGEDSVLSKRIGTWMQTIADDKRSLVEERDALDEAKKFDSAVTNAKSQADRKALVGKAVEQMKKAKEKKDWTDVLREYETATNRLNKAIAAYESAQNETKRLIDDAKTEENKNDHIEAYAKLNEILAKLEEAAEETTKQNAPADAMVLFDDARKKVESATNTVVRLLNQDVDDFTKQCAEENSSEDHRRFITTAGVRKADKRLPESIRQQYTDLHKELNSPVTLTITNESGTPIHVSIDGTEPSILIQDGGAHPFGDVRKWTTNLTLQAKAADKWRDDYNSFKTPVKIGRENRRMTISKKELKQKPSPIVKVQPPLDETSVMVSRDGTNWVALNKQETFTAEAHKPFSVQWKVAGVEADYENPSGKVTVDVGNRGETFTGQIPDPVIKVPPVVQFTPKNNGPALNWTVILESDEARTFKVLAEKSEAVLPEPRTNWIAKAEFKDPEDAREWFPVEEQHFRTGNRGSTTNVPITHRRRPEICVTNESLAAFSIDGKEVGPGAVVSLFGELENVERTVTVLLFDGSDSFYADTTNVVLSFGKANSTDDCPIRLAIDPAKMKVDAKLDDPNAVVESLFAGWEKQLDRLKNVLEKRDLGSFLESCSNYFEHYRESDAYPLKATNPRLADATLAFRLLLLERRLAEMLGDENKKGKVKSEIRKLKEDLEECRGFADTVKSADQEDKAVWDKVEKLFTD